MARAWHDRAFNAFRDENLDPDRKIAFIREPLDGREEKVRGGQTNLTRLIGGAMLNAAKGRADVNPSTKLVVYNSGSVRIDGTLTAGVVTEYDVKRILPYDGDIIYEDIPGKEILKLLNKGISEDRKNSGGYLQIFGAHRVIKPGESPRWETDDGAEIKDGTDYHILFNDYLLMDSKEGFDAPPEATSKPPLRPIGKNRVVIGRLQKALIAEFQRRYGSNLPGQADALASNPSNGEVNRNEITIEGKRLAESKGGPSASRGATNSNTITITLPSPPEPNRNGRGDASPGPEPHDGPPRPLGILIHVLVFCVEVGLAIGLALLILRGQLSRQIKSLIEESQGTKPDVRDAAT